MSLIDGLIYNQKGINKELDCGDCNMCCKLYSIHEPKDFKKDYEWCKHCEVGVGCKIYESRPKHCKDFQC